MCFINLCYNWILLSQCSHLDFFSFFPGFWVEGDGKDASTACFSNRMLGGSPFLFLLVVCQKLRKIMFLLLLALLLSYRFGVCSLCFGFKLLDFDIWRVIMTFPFLNSKRREHSFPCFTFLFPAGNQVRISRCQADIL